MAVACGNDMVYSSMEFPKLLEGLMEGIPSVLLDVRNSFSRDGLDGTWNVERLLGLLMLGLGLASD